MFPHWRYVIDNLFGNVTSLTCLGANHIRKRWDEQGNPYDADADDAAYATLITDKGVICDFNMSWCTRVNREDLLVIQVDGTEGSAVAGLRNVNIQRAVDTPRCVWNPDVENSIDYTAGWKPFAPDERYENAFKAQWELFLRHVALNEPFPCNLKEGAKGVQLAELALKSWEERAWVDLPDM
jgi:predicted dehydrogenase